MQTIFNRGLKDDSNIFCFTSKTKQNRRWTYDKMYCWHSQGDRSIGKVIRNYKDFVATCVDKLQIID